MPSKAEIKTVRSLSDDAERRARNETRLEGAKLVVEGLRRGKIRRVYLAEGFREREAIARACEAAGAPFEIATDADVARMCDTNTPSGVVAVVERNAPIPLDRLLSISPFAVAFDAVQDPGNVGTIARTAAAFGVRALIATPGTADPTAPKTLRASAGALIDLPFAEASSLDALCDAAVAAGRPLIVAATRGGASPSSLADLKSGVFLFGNEGAGVRLSAAASARAIEVTIPLEADAESLNVAAAAAVLLDRRRR